MKISRVKKCVAAFFIIILGSYVPFFFAVWGTRHYGNAFWVPITAMWILVFFVILAGVVAFWGKEI